ncbi:MAG TPA: hypothetical protein PLB16_06625 [bacterium]|nr:hypothetical protein [bacterium]
MRRFAVITILIPLVIFSVLVIYADYGRNIFSVILRCGETVIVISFVAGLLKVLHKEAVKIRKGRFSQWPSAVILLSFLITFLAGAMNINQSKYAFNNIIREQPAYLVETADIIIDDDYYLSKFPARKKLSLYVSANVSPYFFPTDEMLKEADMTSEDFKDLKYKKGIFDEKNTVFINEDDSKSVSELEKKVRAMSIEGISKMLPVAASLREWFTDSLREKGEQDNVQDAAIEGVRIKGSGDMLKEWFDEQNVSGINKNETVKYYADFVRSSGVADIIAESCSKNADMDISKNAASKMFSAFLKTGVTSSPNMKGFVRWIYRSILDPLFSTFIAMLFFSMLLTVYKMLDFRNYSYFVISVSVCLVIAGFFPYFNSVLNFFLSPDWKGPFSEGWLINVFSAPVFKALAIGTGTGVLFYSAETVFEVFTPKNRRGN